MLSTLVYSHLPAPQCHCGLRGCRSCLLQQLLSVHVCLHGSQPGCVWESGRGRGTNGPGSPCASLSNQKKSQPLPATLGEWKAPKTYWHEHLAFLKQGKELCTCPRSRTDLDAWVCGVCVCEHAHTRVCGHVGLCVYSLFFCPLSFTIADLGNFTGCIKLDHVDKLSLENP